LLKPEWKKGIINSRIFGFLTCGKTGKYIKREAFDIVKSSTSKKGGLIVIEYWDIE
jgi:hypothetical protein